MDARRGRPLRRLGPGTAVLALTLAIAGPAAAAEPPDAERAKGKRVDVVLRLEPRSSGIQRLARAVSDPGSADYGEFVDPASVGKRFGADGSTRRSVLSFLRDRGIRAEVDITRSFAHTLVAARTARRLFGPANSTRANIPRGLRGDVRVVLQQPGATGRTAGDHIRARAAPPPRQGELQPPHTRTGAPAGCEQGRNATFKPDGAPLAGPAFTPNQIQTAYSASGLHAQGVTGAGVRAAVFGAGGFGRDELAAFGECFGIEPPPARLVKIGTGDPGPTSDETALDLQMLSLMAPGLEGIDVYAIGSGFWPVDFAAMIDPANAPGGKPPHLISVSQGDCESDLGRAQIELTERILAAAAAAGITIAAGAGDAGSFCSSGRVGFYPGSSRWVTSVGGTALALTETNEVAAESVWNDQPIGLPLAGGGGTSRYVGAGFYQAAVVAGDRRGYPDVAAFGDGYPSIAIYCPADARGNCTDASAPNPFQALGNGTSAATPLFAGAIALADQRRLDAGAPPLGFANPFLYALGSAGGAGALRDVVEGTNDLGRGCCDAGPGFDLASGWGAPSAAGLAAAATPGAR